MSLRLLSNIVKIKKSGHPKIHVIILKSIQFGFSWSNTYRKFPKYSDTQNICCNHSKIWSMWLYHRLMGPNDADGMANSVDPDQTAPLGAVWSGSALFAQAYLSENLRSLRYGKQCRARSEQSDPGLHCPHLFVQN